MASITITIPDEQLTRVVEALCAMADPANPVAPTGANAKAMVIRYIRQMVMEHETKQAVSAIVIDTSGVAS